MAGRHSNLIEVIHFILDPRVGGTHNYVKTIAADLGNTVENKIVTGGKGPTTDLGLLNLRRRWAPLYGVEVIVNAILILLFTWTGKIRRSDTVFAVHGAANIAPLIAGRLLGIPIIWYLHETWNRFRPLAKLGRWVVRGSNHRIVAVAERSARTYGFDGCLIIPPAIDLKFWTLTLGVEFLPTERVSALRVLVVGNLNPLKGHDLLLDALAEFPECFHLRIVGAELDNYREYYRRLIEKKAAIEQRRSNCVIEFTGWKENYEIRAFLEESDVFILPSRSEGSPIALMEAMAMKRVCIATDVGGVGELIIDETQGIVVPAENPYALREALIRVQRMSDLARVEMGMQARERIKKRYAVNILSCCHSNLYRTLLPVN